MPIEMKYPLRAMSQREFGATAYQVMAHAFALHKELGRLFDERTYQRALKRRLGERAQIEVPVRVSHRDFETRYSLDLVLDDGAVFELKTVEAFTGNHRNQLLNYLMLTETHHGKLINFRTASVGQEFVNTSATREDRVSFSVNTSGWNRAPGGSSLFEDILIDMLKDFGTGLSVALYEQAMIHLLGGEEQVLTPVEIVVDGMPCGEEKMKLVNPTTAFWITGLKDDDRPAFETHLRRFLRHSSLAHIQWVNVTLSTVSFRTLSER